MQHMLKAFSNPYSEIVTVSQKTSPGWPKVCFKLQKCDYIVSMCLSMTVWPRPGPLPHKHYLFSCWGMAYMAWEWVEVSFQFWYLKRQHFSLPLSPLTFWWAEAMFPSRGTGRIFGACELAGRFWWYIMDQAAWYGLLWTKFQGVHIFYGLNSMVWAFRTEQQGKSKFPWQLTCKTYLFHKIQDSGQTMWPINMLKMLIQGIHPQASPHQFGKGRS